MTYRRRPRTVAYSAALIFAGLLIGGGLRVALFSNPILGVAAMVGGLVFAHIAIEAHT